MFRKFNMIYIHDDCYLNEQDEVIIHNGINIQLSRIEYRLLKCLIQRPGIPVSSAELIRFAWGDDVFISKQELYVYINRLRKKIEKNPENPRCLLSVRGVGYVLYMNLQDFYCVENDALA